MATSLHCRPPTLQSHTTFCLQCVKHQCLFGFNATQTSLAVVVSVRPRAEPTALFFTAYIQGSNLPERSTTRCCWGQLGSTNFDPPVYRVLECSQPPAKGEAGVMFYSMEVLRESMVLLKIIAKSYNKFTSHYI